MSNKDQKKDKTIIAILSGKGGVGKTNVAVALAKELGAGILDVDLMGPNVPETLRDDEPEREFMGAVNETIPAKQDGLEVMSLSYQLRDHAAFMQDSEFKRDLIHGWLNSIRWESDIVVVDTPPGTSESTRTILEKLPEPHAIIVTTGQDSSIEDCKKSKEMIRHLNEEEDINANINLLGMVENFAWYEPPAWMKDLIEEADEEDLPDDTTLPLLGHNHLGDEFEEPLLSKVPYCKDWADRQAYIGKAVDSILEQDIPRELRHVLDRARMDDEVMEMDQDLEVKIGEEGDAEMEVTTDGTPISKDELMEIKGIGPAYADRITEKYDTWEQIEAERPADISFTTDVPEKTAKRLKEEVEEDG